MFAYCLFRWLQKFMEKVYGKVIAKKNMSNQSQQSKLDIHQEVHKRLTFLENDTEKVNTFGFQVEQSLICTENQLTSEKIWRDSRKPRRWENLSPRTCFYRMIIITVYCHERMFPFVCCI